MANTCPCVSLRKPVPRAIRNRLQTRRDPFRPVVRSSADRKGYKRTLSAASHAVPRVIFSPTHCRKSSVPLCDLWRPSRLRQSLRNSRRTSTSAVLEFKPSSRGVHQLWFADQSQSPSVTSVRCFPNWCSSRPAAAVSINFGSPVSPNPRLCDLCAMLSPKRVFPAQKPCCPPSTIYEFKIKIEP